MLDTKIYDEIIPVENDDAFATGKRARPQRGRAGRYLLRRGRLGPASQLAKRPENKGKTIVVLLPDTGDRYLSTPLFQD